MACFKPTVSGWPEVRYINDYAAFMGFLAMTIRGLGFLVVTWTTVVLLGGFVSLLQKKDFWCLTIITLIQIAGVIDNFGSGEKWGSVGLSALGLNVVYFVSTRNRLVSTTPSGNFVRVVVLVKQLLGWIACFVQAAMYYVVVLCSGFSTVVWGPYICIGVSLWRLKQRDYGNADGESSKSNMNPALDVLYIIVVVQGAILVYIRILNALVKEKAVAEVAKIYGFNGPSVTFVLDYMKETLKGCGKNPSFVRGRNLVTYAMDLMVTPEDFAPGINILSTILGPLEGVESTRHASQCWLIRKLVLYAPSCQTFRFLLFISNPRNNRYGIEIPRATRSIGSTEVRKHAANIVLHMADGASPELLPQVLQCICSLIGTFQEHQCYFSSNSTDNDSDYAKEEKDYLKRLWEGLHVLFVLAADKNNCNLIVNTPGLLTKIMTPLASNLYHQTDHDAWGDVVLESLKVMHRLTHGHEETQETLVHEFITNKEALKNIKGICVCSQCSQQMHNLARGVLANLNMQQVEMRNQTREKLIEGLADIYTYSTHNLSRISALEALEELCSQDGSNAAIILQVNGSAVYTLTANLEVVSNGYNRYNMIVAEILQRACLHYTTDDECLSVLKESMTCLIPKVLKKIITAEATPTGQPGGALQNNGQSRSSSSRQEIQKQQDLRIVETALLSLCVTVHETFISADQYLAVQFDDAIGEFSLPVKLREMVERNSDATPNCLKILKLTSRMAVSMMKCRGSRYPKPDLESLVEALSKACSRKMYFIDSSKNFASGDDAAKTMKPERTFASFVTEAMDLVRDYRA